MKIPSISLTFILSIVAFSSQSSNQKITPTSKNVVSSQQLSNNNIRANDNFGSSTAIFGDRAIVGASGDNLSQGSANVFEFDGDNWVFTDQLRASSPSDSGDLLGSQVSLKENRALISGFGYNNGSGIAYIFDFDGNSWNQTAALLPNVPQEQAFFGNSVSLSGNRAVIGAVRNNAAGTDAGIVYVFELDGNNWNQSATLLSSDISAEDNFGSAVSIEGDRIVVGAESKGSGAAYVFEFNGSSWDQTAKLSPEGGEIRDMFGFSVALNNDQIIVGSPTSTGNTSNSGSSYIFEFDGNSWVQTSQLTANDGAFGDQFGISVKINGDRALVTAPSQNGNNQDTGAAYLFQKRENEWVQTEQISIPDSQLFDRLGADSDLSQTRAIVGAPNVSIEGNNAAGTAFVYELEQFNNNTFNINSGLNGVWFNIETSGQGFFMEVLPDLQKAFIGWFTFDTGLPDSSISTQIGATGNRWMTSLGDFGINNNHTINFDLVVTTGGIFDDPRNVTNSEPQSIGNLQIEFINCFTGIVTYELFLPQISRSFEITRIAADNIPLCESLAE